MTGLPDKPAGSDRGAASGLLDGLRSRATPMGLLVLMSIALPLSFSTWSVLINNFIVEQAAFTGREVGIMQSLREVPGFLAFTAAYVLLILSEQRFALASLTVLGLGTALTGLLPFEYGIYFSTVLMSIGFHYFETIKQSLSLQWFNKDDAPQALGRLLAIGSGTSLVMYSLIWLALEFAAPPYWLLFGLSGLAVLVLTAYMHLAFPMFASPAAQTPGIVLKRRYWLYYVLTFFSGARRQIFVVFAAFLMVEKFGFSAQNIAGLFLITYAFNWAFAERIGALIHRIGERAALTFEYVGLGLLFVCYALVDNAALAAGLYVVDHLFFALAIAIKTYFQKIADPQDMAGSAGVAFTINHIAAVLVPASLGVVWLWSPAAVFLVGAGFAACSLVCAQLVPRHPVPGSEVRWQSTSEGATRRV
ncbi:MAG: hypothetical protein NXH85_04885 [Pseudomonadaceae bacterium]|nr:hypothetical protein [Pseudomonadaceae bacterium]